MKELICKAFCDSVSVTELPKNIGFGISSSMFEVNGDMAGVYAIGPDKSGYWRLDDSGWVAPMLSSSGYDISSAPRLQVFEEVLAKSGLMFDQESLEIYVERVAEKDVPATAIRFFSALARVSDLGGWSQDRIKSTFRSDVASALRDLLPNVEMLENAAADPRVPDLLADLVLQAPGGTPVALYLAQSEVSLLEAMLMRSETASLPSRPKVVAIMEREKSAPIKTRTRAHNRLDVVTVYEGDTRAAVLRIAEEVGLTIH